MRNMNFEARLYCGNDSSGKPAPCASHGWTWNE